MIQPNESLGAKLSNNAFHFRPNISAQSESHRESHSVESSEILDLDIGKQISRLTKFLVTKKLIGN